MVALESVSLFRNLPPEELETLRGIVAEQRFAAGGEIFREGDPGNGVYVVKAGLVEISGLVGGDSRRVFSRLGPGEIFGEMAVIEERPRSATASASRPTDVYFIPRGAMLERLQRLPVLAGNLLQEICRRLRDFNQLHLREVMHAERLAIVGNFARSIIHDMKTPLTIIGLCADLAGAPGATPDERARAREGIRRQVERINDLVGDILEFTRGQPPEATLAPATFSEFIAELLPALQADAGINSIRLELQNPPPASKVRLDARRLGRVFFNLVHNAADAMPAGGKIFIRFQSTPAEIVTEMEDTGPGLAPEIAGQLFQPFATHGKAHGTGLGLSICKKIVEDHCGRIWTRTAPGRGAIFCIALPAVT